MLTVRGVKTYYGNIPALRGVDLEVNQGEIVALIGTSLRSEESISKSIKARSLR